jgi:hypothetical protein
MSEIESSTDAQLVDEPDKPGLYLYGIVRARGWRGLERRNRAVTRVRYRDIEALVKGTSFQLPESEEALTDHHTVVESVMKRTTILPVPFGIVFRGRRRLVAFLQEQYLVIDEGLSLLDGHSELRLHVEPTESEEGPTPVADERMEERAMTIYGELRRYARAAVPFPTDDQRVLGAAFLVERTRWDEFVQRIEAYGEQHPGLTFDVSGPWPPYDFVRIVT